jgi:hypothetical protein
MERYTLHKVHANLVIHIHTQTHRDTRANEPKGQNKDHEFSKIFLTTHTREEEEESARVNYHRLDVKEKTRARET